MEVVRIVLGVVLLVVTAALAVQLWKGRWLFLIAKPDKTKKGTFYPEGTHKSGQCVSWVMVACFAVIATLIAYQMGILSGSDLFAQAATILSNIALVAYCVVLVWAVFSSQKGKEGSFRERFDGGSYRVLILLLGTCVLLTVIGLLFV
ncbi:MAG: lipocalin [Gordonibacter sp.]|uniref:lipocalin n=1 Tax=Gordonibacter sp. TaxID=1968902 RepID=UPI002FC76A9A